MKSKKATKPLSTGCLSLFGLPFLLAGLFISWLYFSGIKDWWNAQRWVEVPCWIDSAELKVSRGDGTTYEALADYHYIHDGITYQGDRVSFSTGSDNVGSFHQDIHRELSQYTGKKARKAERETGANGEKAFRCYVNPSKPSEAVLYRGFRWQSSAFFAIFVLTFPAVGAGLVVGGLIGMKSAGRVNALRAKHPEMPWRWNNSWAGDSIPETNGPSRTALYFYTLWATLVLTPLILATAWSGAFQADRSSWWLAIFVVFWAIPLAVSLKSLCRHLCVGATRFEPKTWPWSPGGGVQGHLLFQKPLPIRADAEAVLTCTKSVTSGSGDNRSTTKETVWSQTQSVPQDRMIRDLTGFRLPVSFHIPADAPETGGEMGEGERMDWQLEFKAAGTPIHSKFEIPVFHTADSRRSAASQATASQPGSPSVLNDTSVNLPALLAARRITASFDDQGHPTLIHCPPCRNRSLVLFLLVFDLIWTAAAVILIKQNAPLLFQIVWPLSAGVIWLVIFWNLLHQRKVTFDQGGLRIVEKLGPFSWEKSFEKSAIVGFTHDTNMSSGNTRFYRVRLESVIGKKRVILDNITESTTAELLTRRLDAWKSAR